MTKHAGALAGMLGAQLAGAQPTQADLRTLRLADSCTVTCPKVLRIGAAADLSVAFHGRAEKTKLCCDLHYPKTDGTFGG